MHDSAFLPRLPGVVRLVTLLGTALVVAATLLALAGDGGTPTARAAQRDVVLPTTIDPLPPRVRDRVTRAMRTHGCSAASPSTASLRSALVLVAGTPRHVDVDRGWEVYTGVRPGRFVALCGDAFPSEKP